ncbi:hypothetical protein P171DRAFT_438264 [Karstenula rhodostoma CBS 690.94]|uniref:Uncharacterized protein n=1 Tax=Karstenula rhodostoma CBS 690.94 TaxID=1392251 RepID=A0A9P4UIC0_9PLEO|nr:hypothetical protein P171DRAFT_438264 [Karstenula rhodostoma CBS 690.94]
MDSDTYTDPLASLFRPTDKPRFANLDWPVWDSAVFDRNVQALKKGHELAFIAGTTYVRRAVSVQRPKKLPELVDKATLNHLGRWGFTGFIIGEERALEQIEEDRDLLSSFRSGVFFAMNHLRNAEVPGDVNKEDLKEVIDALESYTHGHFVAMAELGPGVAEAVRVENAFMELNAMRMADDSESQEEDEHSEKESTTEGKLQNEPNAKKTTEQKDEESRDHTKTSAKDYGDDDDDDEGSEYFEELEILEGIVSPNDADDEGEEDTTSPSFAETDIADGADATHKSEVVSARRGKRTKTKKAKKAKMQAKCNKKKVEALPAET